MTVDLNRIQNQIRAMTVQLANINNYANTAKSADELKRGTISLTINTEKKRFIFNSPGITNPLYIDPITKSLNNIAYLNNVAYLNNIDVSKLITSLKGLNNVIVTEKGDGEYEINLKFDIANYRLKKDLIYGKNDSLALK